jgi:sulfate adenylyltransferase
MHRPTTHIKDSLSFNCSKSAPHGGKLVNTMAASEAEKNQLMSSCDFEVELDERQLCDVELLMQGGFSPLDGYMSQEDYTSVVNDLKLTNGLIFGLVSNKLSASYNR